MLPGGGIAAGALHEVAGSPALADDAAATIFMAGILARTAGPVLWCLRWRDLFAPALGLAGLASERIIFVEAGSDTNVLIAMEECLRHAGLAGVVGELGTLPLTASRWLQLAAEQSGVPAFVFRRALPLAAEQGGSAATTRWRGRAHPSERLNIPSLARARWSIALERARGGEPPSLDRGGMRCAGSCRSSCRPGRPTGPGGRQRNRRLIRHRDPPTCRW